MIADIPTADDFRNSGIDFLNLAWERLVELLKDLSHAQEYFGSFEYEGIEEDGEEIVITSYKHTISSDAYWKQAQRHLGTSLSLVEQGTEFLLKSGIVEVSPFLLIANSPSNFPRNSQEKDVRFSEFRTVDAQDLIRIYNTVAKFRLPDEFHDLFENLRSRRNTIMHTVDPSMQIGIKDLLVELLEVCHYLLGEKSWIGIRKSYIDRAPDSVLAEPKRYQVYDSEILQLSSEMTAVIALLPPADVKRYFLFDKKRRRYMCPQCLDGGFSKLHNKGYLEHIPKLAQLSSSGTEVYCLVCEQKSPVIREDCGSPSCKGNVIGGEYNTCLTCGTGSYTWQNNEALDKLLLD